MCEEAQGGTYTIIATWHKQFSSMYILPFQYLQQDNGLVDDV